MGKALRVLMVDDSEVFPLLLLGELKRGGYEPAYERVNTPEAMAAALDGHVWNLILSDYTMPHFSAPAALQLVQNRGLDLPFIVVSEAIGEELAAQMMKAGASDYISKTNLIRLVPAIEWALREAEDHRKRNRVERERRLMEGQLRQAQKLESIGQLAAGIAHEINTPTQYIGDNTRFLKDAFIDLIEVFQVVEQMVAAGAPPDQVGQLFLQLQQAASRADLGYLALEIPKAIQQSLEGVERVARIVRAMKEFSHPGTEGKAPTDLNKAIESTLTVSRNEWKYVAELVTEFDPVLPAVPCLLGEFNQVILNLVVNAAHAIADVVGDGGKGKGILTVKTRRDGDWAEVRIGDTGTGIPESVRDKIFDPFFTTKGVGKGTGQGLAIAHAVVVEKHGGSITLETEVGRGTTFIIRLPIKVQTVPSTKNAA
jgi:signal transduction histidine kinase